MVSEQFPGDAGGFLAGFPPGSRVAGYRLEEQVGAGGMAVVFRARDERLGRLVALKILAPALRSDEAFRQRFIRESRSAAAVDDPHIIPVFEAGEASGVLFIAMRYVPGGDVRTLLHREGPLPPARAAAIISPVASALDSAHAAGLVHRDVKPANMLVDVRPDRPDHVYLSDFGLSKRAMSSVGLTSTGQFLGTPNYTAPEQIEGRTVNGQTDQYALACAAFELLSGEAPFERDQPMAVFLAHLSQPPPSLSSRRPELGLAADEAFARALAKAPEDRYPTCREFADALREALGVAPYHTGPGAIRPTGGPATKIASSAAPGTEELTTPAGAAAAAAIGPAPDEADVPAVEAKVAAPTAVASDAGGAGPDSADRDGLALRTAPGEGVPAGTMSAPPTLAAATRRGRSGPDSGDDGRARSIRRRRRIAPVLAAGSVLAVAGIVIATNQAGPAGHGAAATTPVYGGTLRLVAASGPDHIDTVPAYYTAAYILERAYARQLLSYPTVPDPTLSSAGWKTDTTPVADIATVVPTIANGGITNGAKTYTFHIRPGVDWNTSPARQVTADDFIREFKAFCNPVSPVGNLGYYSTTIAGLTQYCNTETAYFANAKQHPPTAANIAGFQNSHTISGLVEVNSSTLQFNLMAPAADFAYMLAMPWASARPVEYDAYVPDSLQLDQHTISDGPYQITSFVPNTSIALSKNPAWKQSADPVRHQYVNKVTLTDGVTSAQTQLADMQAGTYDLVDDTTVDPTAIPTLLAKHDPKFKIWPWTSTLPYVVFNLRSPNSNGAMGKLLVRQAIEYGINKVAVQKAQGGPALSPIISTAIPPGNVVYQNYNLYPDNNGNGNTAKCKADLAAAGYPHGVSLTYLYVNNAVNSRTFAAIQASLKPCGVNLVGKAEPGSSFFVDLGNSPVNNQPGTWDLGQAGWFPDWFGNNGRTIIGPLFDERCVVNTTNYGCYSSKTLDNIIVQAETALTLAQAVALWHQADMNVMANAVIVPLCDGQASFYSSARVQNAGSTAIVYGPNIGGPDITNVWLNPNTP